MKHILVILLFVCLHHISYAIQSDTICSVEWSYRSCYGDGQRKLIVCKKDGDVVAHLVDGKISLSRALTPTQLTAFYQFIDELKTRKFSTGCTSTEEYTVKINNELIHKTDGSCIWNGFSKLHKTLFGFYV